MPNGCGGLITVSSMPLNEDDRYAVSIAVVGADLSYAGGLGASRRHTVAVEMPVNVIYGSIPFAVMMTSPADLEDFAYGFSFTEGIIDEAGDIRGVEIAHAGEGIKLSIVLKAENMQRHLGRARNLAGRTGCGVCGIADLGEMPVAQAQTAARCVLDTAALVRALKDSEALQTLNRKTRAVHGAAFCRSDGTIVAMREDVGRHNALDKLIGAMLRSGVKAGDGFVLITSRASYEMVEKTVRFGAGALAAISAPTSLAIERARRYGLTLVAVAREDGAIAFTGLEQIAERGMG